MMTECEKLFGMAMLMLLFAGCAATPKLDTSNVAADVTPRQVLQNPEGYRGQNVLLGGVIVNSTNQTGTTLLEILSYPLDRDQKPRTREPAQGRFLASYPGYLETVDYSAGRIISIVGNIEGTQNGRIGEADYTYPYLAIREHYLWPASTERQSQPRVNFGIGVIFSN
jgi:outer membrane lipoprotein